MVSRKWQVKMNNQDNLVGRGRYDMVRALDYLMEDLSFVAEPSVPWQWLKAMVMPCGSEGCRTSTKIFQCFSSYLHSKKCCFLCLFSKLQVHLWPCLCLWDTHSCLLLVGPANGNAAARSPSPVRGPSTLGTGLGSSGWAGVSILGQSSRRGQLCSSIT